MAPTRRRVLALSSALAAGTLLSGCLSSSSTSSSDGSENEPGTLTGTEKSDPVSTDESAIETLAHGNAEFGLTLLSSLAKENPTENQFLSPFSVSVALAMTYASARGETRDGMANALRFPLTVSRSTPRSLRVSTSAEWPILRGGARTFPSTASFSMIRGGASGLKERTE